MIKRTFDVSVSLLALLLLSPLLALIALLVRAKLGLPILFCQVRPGLHGKPFTLLKFRTMVAGAENGRGALRAYTAGRKARSSVDLAA